ncbi:hypothetical protein [Streptomyces sp. NPDC005141]
MERWRGRYVRVRYDPTRPGQPNEDRTVGVLTTLLLGWVLAGAAAAIAVDLLG